MITNELSTVRNGTPGIYTERVAALCENAVGDDTKALIVSGVSENTLRNYRFWSREVEVWLGGRSLGDGLLVEYITGLHHAGRSLAAISQAVAAVRWVVKRTFLPPPQAGGKGSGRGEGLWW